jgi:hypothetical protein
MRWTLASIDQATNPLPQAASATNSALSIALTRFARLLKKTVPARRGCAIPHSPTTDIEDRVFSVKSGALASKSFALFESP